MQYQIEFKLAFFIEFKLVKKIVPKFYVSNKMDINYIYIIFISDCNIHHWYHEIKNNHKKNQERGNCGDFFIHENQTLSIKKFTTNH